MLVAATGFGAYLLLHEPGRGGPSPAEAVRQAEPNPAEQAAAPASKDAAQAPASGSAAPSVAVARPLTPGATFQDCAHCPTMVVIPAGSFAMGQAGGRADEGPVHLVTIPAPFALGQREVTFAEWDACVAEGGCSYRPGDRGWGRGAHPVIDLSWDDAQAYLAWLSKVTGKRYRLPTEAEWEYSDRAGTTSAYWWGDAAGIGHAACTDCGPPASRTTMPTGSFAPNGFSLYDTAGNAAEWVQDCWSANYVGAPSNGRAVESPQCPKRVLRGGSFASDARSLRSATRFKYDADVRYYANGFRVARDIEGP